MRLRYYRRVIEIRDGLVCVIPYVAEPVDSKEAIDEQAELICNALARSAEGTQIEVTSVLAAPGAAGMEADTQHLLSLSNVLGQAGKSLQRAPTELTGSAESLSSLSAAPSEPDAGSVTGLTLPASGPRRESLNHLCVRRTEEAFRESELPIAEQLRSC